VRSFFIVQNPSGYRTFINLASVSDATYGPGSDAPDAILEHVNAEENLFVISMKQIVGQSRSQNYFWWQGLQADIVQADFLKALRAGEPVYTVLLPAED
jgi:hypothetical protein